MKSSMWFSMKVRAVFILFSVMFLSATQVEGEAQFRALSQPNATLRPQFRPLSSPALPVGTTDSVGFFEAGTSGCNYVWITQRAFVTPAHCVTTADHAAIGTRFSTRGILPSMTGFIAQVNGARPVTAIFHASARANDQGRVEAEQYDLAVVIFDQDVATRVATIGFSTAETQEEATVAFRRNGQLEQYPVRILRVDPHEAGGTVPAFYLTTNISRPLDFHVSGAALFNREGQLLGVLRGDSDAGLGFFALLGPTGVAIINRAITQRRTAMTGLDPLTTRLTQVRVAQAANPPASTQPAQTAQPGPRPIPSTGSYVASDGLNWDPVVRQDGAIQRMRRQEAIDYCTHIGKRLPTQEEFQTLRGQLGFPNHYDPSPVPDLWNTFWSSSVEQVVSSYYGIYFNGPVGDFYIVSPRNQSHVYASARCVGR